MEIIIVPPRRCNTCKHHILGDYDPATEYQEHWCEIEDNEMPGWSPGMHLDHCVFFPSSDDEVCPCYEMMELPPELL